MSSIVKKLFVFVIPLMLTSCIVSKKKYEEMVALKNSVQAELEEQKKENKELEAEMDRKEEVCDSTIEALRADTTRLIGEIQSKMGELNELRDVYDDLNYSCKLLSDNYDKLKSQSSAKLQKLIAEVEALQADLQEREKKLNEVEAKLAARDSAMVALKNRLSKALFGFKDKGLTVEIRDGKVYVSLSNQLLFASGSTKIDSKGQEALKELAKVLKDQVDLAIMVEGHTDDVPVSNLGQIKDNWDLSVMRSTEVVRILTQNGVDPANIIASGRSEFHPVNPEDSPEARSKNRRTEIILSPKLDELMEILNP